MVFARYVGLTKAHTQHLLEAIAYNLYRAQGIIISNAQKQVENCIAKENKEKREENEAENEILTQKKQKN